MCQQPLHERYQSFLLDVQTPGQYVGGEWNTIHKPDSDITLRVALAFPDAYTIGMSYHGNRIFYELLNGLEGIAAERCFTPFPDMEAQLRAHNEPLATLESGTPLSACDVVSFSLQYELCGTNVLTMLDLGGIPLLAQDRNESHPLIIAGGAGAYNPEPFAQFFDLFLVGEGEEALPEMLAIMRECREQHLSREATLAAIVRTSEGWYAPSLYDVTEANGIQLVTPRHPDAPARIRRRIIHDLDAALQPTRPIVPVVETVHERVVLEIMRGCPNGCRFCQAGMMTRPRRHRSVASLCEAARTTYANTGYDEIGLLSLSTSDYPHFSELVATLDAEFAPKGVGLSLPSLRVDTQLRGIPEQVTSVRKGGFTIAPEAGTDRLRNAVNKWVTDEDLRSGAKAAYDAGWRNIKLYFMIGLPTETMADVEAIPALSRSVALQKKTRGGGQAVTMSVSNFVPKPHTAFQWCGMDTAEMLTEKQARLDRLIDRKLVSGKKHPIIRSLLEGVLARGDRKAGDLILRAWQRGARMDAWDEHFNLSIWEAAFADHGCTMESIACRSFEPGSPLPWSHIDSGVRDGFLLDEWHKATHEEKTPACSATQCGGCQMPGCKIIGATSSSS